MKLVLLSDTHNRLRKVSIPDGDVLIHAGDLTGRGEAWEIEKELEVLSKASAPIKLLTPGNHDFGFQLFPDTYRKMCLDYGITLLIDESTIIDGLKFYMSPYTAEFFNWAYMLPRGEPLKQHWSKVPDDVDVLITHGQPYGINDPAYDGASVGDQDLSDRIKGLKKLKLYVGGHLHGGYNVQVVDGVIYVNPSICTDRYDPTNKPIELTL